MGRKKKYNLGSSSGDDALLTPVWGEDEADSSEDVSADEEAVEVAPAVVAEPAPVAEPVVSEPVVAEPEPAPAAPRTPKKYRFGQYFEDPRYGRVQVVSVPKNGQFKVRVMKTRSVIRFTEI